MPCHQAIDYTAFLPSGAFTKSHAVRSLFIGIPHSGNGELGYSSLRWCKLVWFSHVPFGLKRVHTVVILPITIMPRVAKIGPSSHVWHVDHSHVSEHQVTSNSGAFRNIHVFVHGDMHALYAVPRSVSMDAAIAFFQNALTISSIHIEETE